MEHIGDGIRRFPGRCEVAVRNPVIVQFDQTVEDQAVNSFGLSVGANARVQIGRHRFDQEINDTGFGLDGARTGGE